MAPNPSRESQIPRHYGHPFGVKGAHVRVFEQVDKKHLCESLQYLQSLFRQPVFDGLLIFLVFFLNFQ